jgi:hypothetical protein
MDKKTKVIVCVVAAHKLLPVMVMIIHSRKRKRNAWRTWITYAPMHERDRIRIEYLNTKIWRDDTTCINLIRMKRACFFRLTRHFREHGLL